MRIKTSTIICLTIAAILTAYLSALTLVNQAFGVCNHITGCPPPTPAENHHEVCLPCIQETNHGEVRPILPIEHYYPDGRVP
jgi:hypothetical protein